MALVYLVRHGEAAATFGEADDPGLSALGRDQAEAAARALQGLGLRSAICSPMRRCRETSAPFAALTGAGATIVDAVGEIPTPKARAADRQVWLRGVMAGSWRTEPDFTPWRTRLTQTLAAIGADTVVFSHFVAINVAVGAATGSDRVVNFSPMHCSITVLETAPGGLRLITLGAQAEGGRVL